jgi:hypothetical protein
VVDATLIYNNDTVTDFVSDAKRNVSQLSMLGVTLPLVGGILGVLLLIGGLVVGARSPGRRVASAPAPSREAGAV